MITKDRAKPRSLSTSVGGGEIQSQAIWAAVRTEILAHIQRLQPGESLPTYEQLAAQVGCSITPVKRAMEELARQGWVSLQRGRRARVLWVGSFRRSVERSGQKVHNRVFVADCRALEPSEESINCELGLQPGEQCIVLGRVRIVSGQAAAMQRTYINPRIFANPSRLFLDHDVATVSLREVYAGLGVRPLRVTAALKVDLADGLEREILSLPNGAPVLRSHQVTVVELAGKVITLEVMDASYTKEISYTVERIPRWDEHQATRNANEAS